MDILWTDFNPALISVVSQYSGLWLWNPLPPQNATKLPRAVIIMIINQTNELAGAVGQPWSDPILPLHHMSTTGL